MRSPDYRRALMTAAGPRISPGPGDPRAREAAEPAVAVGRAGRSLRSLSRSPLNGSIVGQTSEHASTHWVLERTASRRLSPPAGIEDGIPPRRGRGSRDLSGGWSSIQRVSRPFLVPVRLLRAERQPRVYGWKMGMAGRIGALRPSTPDRTAREFVDDARIANRRSTGASRTPAAPQLGADDSYWIDWARSYRVSAVESLLREARASASRTCEAMLTAAAEEQTDRAGLGTGSCVTASCGRHVLRGKAFCCRCLAERDRARFERDAEVTEIRRVMGLLSGGLPGPPLQRR